MASLFGNLSKRVMNSIKSLEKKIVTYPVEERIKHKYQSYRDMAENRELVVVDKFGNKYYQYYSNQGLPTKRIVHLNMTSFNKWDDDPIMLGWLARRQLIPPSQEELEKMYIDNEEFMRKGLEWDRKENKLMEEYRKKQKAKLQEEKKDQKSIGEGQSFQPGVWDKNQLVEVKENPNEVQIIEDVSEKYIVDINEMNERWMNIQEQKMLAPLKEVLPSIDWSEYTVEKMNKKYLENLEREREEIKEKKKAILAVNQRMEEKKEAYARYSGFKERFKDVFEELERKEIY